MPVGELGENLAVLFRLSLPGGRAHPVLREAKTRDDFESQAHPLLFVGVDPLPTLGDHVLHAEEVAHVGGQFRPAVVAEVLGFPGRQGVQVAALSAPLCPTS